MTHSASWLLPALFLLRALPTGEPLSHEACKDLIPQQWMVWVQATQGAFKVADAVQVGRPVHHF